MPYYRQSRYGPVRGGYYRQWSAKQQRYIRARARTARSKALVARRQQGYVRTSGRYGRFGGSTGELKWADIDMLDATLGSTMQIGQLTTIPQGDGASQRVGTKICLKKLNMRLHFTMPTAAATSPDPYLIRVMIVQDTQTNGAQFTATDLLVEDTIHSFRNLDNVARFKIIFDKILTINVTALDGAGYGLAGRIVFLKKNIPLNIPIQYQTSTTNGDVSTIKTNNLYLATQIQGTAEKIQMDGTCRVRYEDSNR
jgi:hypothetical protein